MRRAIINIPACLILLLCLAAVPALAADYETGIQAYMNKDFAGAVRELLPLAAEGDARAQYAAGVLYQKGEGVTQDHAQAWYWFSKAEAQGHDKAGQARLRLEAEMSPEELAQGQQTLQDESVGAQPGPAPEPVPESIPEPVIAPQPEPEPQPVAEPEPEPEPAPQAGPALSPDQAGLALAEEFLHPKSADPALRINNIEAFAQSRGLTLVDGYEVDRMILEPDNSFYFLANNPQSGPLTGASLDMNEPPTYIEYLDGRIHGLKVIYGKNPAGAYVPVSVANFENDRESGTTVEYYLNGRPKKLLFYENGAYHGPGYTWREDGSPDHSEFYLRDQKDGQEVFLYPDGGVRQYGSWNAGQMDGWFRSFHPNGQMETEQQWSMGKCAGPRVTYTENGKQLSSEPCGSEN